jgi:putative ABC transport system ATP-binding protein
MIELCGVSHCYGSSASRAKVLTDVSFTIGRGELVALVGPSGSGKTTAMYIMGLMQKPTSGQVLCAGQDMTNADAAACANMRRQHIGFVFQQFLLLPRLTVLENIMLPLRYRGESAAVAEERARQVLMDLDMVDFSARRPDALSGGQQQRIAIARAMVGQPGVLLADEPTGALDSNTGAQVLELLTSYPQSYNAAVVIVTHDERVAQQCDRVITISDGRLRPFVRSVDS